MNCWLASLSDTPCEGRLVRGHLIAQQTIKREFPNGAYRLPSGRWVRIERGVRMDRSVDQRSRTALVDNPATWVWVCGGLTGVGGHHGLLDHPAVNTLRIPRSELPGAVEEWASAHGLGWYLDRQYGER